MKFFNAALDKMLKFDADDLSLSISPTYKTELESGLYGGTLTVSTKAGV